MFLEQNSLYFCQKPPKATALLRFMASIQKFSVLTKLRGALKFEIVLQEKAKTTDNADAYRWFLMHYCDAISLFKEILPYVASTLHRSFLMLFSLIFFLFPSENLSVFGIDYITVFISAFFKFDLIILRSLFAFKLPAEIKNLTLAQACMLECNFNSL